MNQLTSGKAPEWCSIDAEIPKAGEPPPFCGCTHNILCSISNTGIMSTDWRLGVVIPIWKGKDDTKECNKYRGTTIPFAQGKVLVRILLDRVRRKLLTH